ncbi:MAG: cytochrome P450 [Acidimicrobiales bacterium]
MSVDYDPLSEEAMTDPQPLYAQLRAHDPVHYMAKYDAWALASFAAVWQVCSDTSSFSVRRGPTPNQILLGEPASDLTFAGLDPPEHRLRRRVLAPFYTREAAERDDATIHAIARSVVDTLLSQTTRFDAYGDYAHVVAGRFAATKAGVPLREADWLRERIGASFQREPGQRGTSEPNIAATIEVFTYLHGLVIDSRQNPADAKGVLATLLDAKVEGVALTDEQVAAELHTLMVTGSDTTEFGLAAALYHLARNPEQRAEVIADPAHCIWAFAEALRLDHPTDILCRSALRDVEVGGASIRQGQGLLLIWASANRDEAEYPDADRFDIHRRYDRSLLFGHGQHKCIGEHIGMRMGAVMLEELITRIASFEVDFDRVGRRRGEFLKGFDRMPIEVIPRGVGSAS